MTYPNRRKKSISYSGPHIDDINEETEKLIKKNTAKIYEILIISGILVMDIDGDYDIKTKHFNGSFKVAKQVQKKKKKKELG